MEQILHIPKGKREPNIVHHRQANDLRAGFEIAKRRAFGHPMRLRDRPTPFKMISSDNTLGTVVNPAASFLPIYATDFL